MPVRGLHLVWISHGSSVETCLELYSSRELKKPCQVKITARKIEKTKAQRNDVCFLWRTWSLFSEGVLLLRVEYQRWDQMMSDQVPLSIQNLPWPPPDLLLISSEEAGSQVRHVAVISAARCEGERRQEVRRGDEGSAPKTYRICKVHYFTLKQL